MKENDFFLGTPRIRWQQYPKSTSTQKVSDTEMTPCLEYPCFIAYQDVTLFLFIII